MVEPGDEFTRRACSGEGYPIKEAGRGIPVIYMTEANSPQLDLRAQKLGALGLLHKPINFSELLNCFLDGCSN